MNADEWELLSPRYFSDILVPLFNGGLITFLLIFALLFFGTIIMPAIVRLIKKRVEQRRLNQVTIIVDPDRKKPLLTLTEIPQYLPDDSWSYSLFYYTSLILSIFYFVAHVAISLRPTTILTTGVELQWLSADDVAALIHFLYRWVLTGYALVVLSIALGLDFIARWMAVSWPREMTSTPLVVTVPEVSTTQVLSPPTPPLPTIAPMSHAALEDVLTSIKQSSFLVETKIERTNHRKKGEDKLMHDNTRPVCVSIKGQIEYEDEWPSGDEMQRLLRFRSDDGMWCVAFLESPHVRTSVRYSKGGRWQLLTNEVQFNDKVVKFKWEIDGVRYYCDCTRYVKL